MNSPVVTVTLNPAIDKTVTVYELQVGGLNRVTESRSDPGGKGINVARVLKNFGVDVTATGFIAGLQGNQLFQQLQTTDMVLDFIKVDGETRTNLKIIGEKTKITTEINECGFDVSYDDLSEFNKKLSSLLENASLLVLGGSIPKGLPERVYKETIKLAHSKGIRTILDADGVSLIEGIQAQPYAIKPNIFELEQIVGHPLNNEVEIVHAGRELIEKGITIVLISLGAKGAICLNKQEAFKVTPFSIDASSTVGAGDSMVGALSYALLNNFSLRDIAVWTTTAGTITASKPGTQVCTFQEVNNAIGKVHLSIL